MGAAAEPLCAVLQLHHFCPWMSSRITGCAKSSSLAHLRKKPLCLLLERVLRSLGFVFLPVFPGPCRTILLIVKISNFWSRWDSYRAHGGVGTEWSFKVLSDPSPWSVP